MLYEPDTLEDIRCCVLNALRGKQNNVLLSALKLLEKHPQMQKDSDIWDRLESILNGDNKSIKREIIRLFENSNENITKYLLDMYDDDSQEIRLFAFEKLSKINNFHSIDPKTKVKLFFVGLSDTSPKVKVYAKKVLKNYLMFLGIIKSKPSKSLQHTDRMDIDSEATPSVRKRLFEEEENDSEKSSEKEEYITESAKAKLDRVTSPLKPSGKKLTDSPSRILDELDVLSYYNHPKYSYVFTLITEAMLEIIDQVDIVSFCRDIIDNLTNIIQKTGEIKQFTSEKKQFQRRSSFSSSQKEKVDKYALFNDIYFLQNTLTILKQDKAQDSFKSEITDMLPDGTTYSKVLAFFYVSQSNIFILHQLLLIGTHLPFQDEVGNREVLEFIHKFICDTTLPTKKANDCTFRRQMFKRMDSKPEDTYNDYTSDTQLTEEKRIELHLNNCLLPSHRRIILSMEDLVEHCLWLMKLIFTGKDNLLFTSIMEVVGELREYVDIDVDNSLKQQQKALLEMFKEKITLVESLQDKLSSAKGEKRLECQAQLNSETKELNNLDKQLYDVTQKEGHVLYRVITLCKFAVNHCKLPPSMFDNMASTIVIPGLKRKEIHSVLMGSLEITGLLSINHFNSTYKNFLKLFFDNLTNDKGEEFKEQNLITLNVVFDSMLINNLLLLPPEIMNGNVEEKIYLIIHKYLYHPSATARVIVFMGICKLLMIDRLTNHEYLLSRLFVCLYKSFQVFDKESEEYNIKIYELMNTFMYFYSLKGKKYIKNVVEAVNVILTSQLMFGNESAHDKSALGEYSDTKFEFLNRFIYIVYDNSSEKSTMPIISLIFKLFKYIYFVFKYKKEQDRNINSNNKKIHPGYTIYSSLKKKVTELFSKTNYDRLLLEYFKEQDTHFGRFYSYMFVMNEVGGLNEFSECLQEEFNDIKNNGHKVELNGTVYDFSSEEKMKEIHTYMNNKEELYYSKIEEHYNYCLQLKENVSMKRIFNENSKILEANEEESDGDGDRDTGEREREDESESGDESRDDGSKNESKSNNTKYKKRKRKGNTITIIEEDDQEKERQSRRKKKTTKGGTKKNAKKKK